MPLHPNSLSIFIDSQSPVTRDQGAVMSNAQWAVLDSEQLCASLHGKRRASAAWKGSLFKNHKKWDSLGKKVRLSRNPFPLYLCIWNWYKGETGSSMSSCKKKQKGQWQLCLTISSTLSFLKTSAWFLTSLPPDVWYIVKFTLVSSKCWVSSLVAYGRQVCRRHANLHMIALHR